MINKLALIIFCLWLCLWTSLAYPALPELPFSKPKLIVVLVIDQFRADYLTRFQNRFLPPKTAEGKLGGFQYLISQGAYFPFAQYDLLQCMTGPGHATILTGSYPYQSGIALNNWYDHSTHEHVYCTEDQSQPTVGAHPKSSHVGTSPKNLIGTTVGDELKNAGYSSQVISIALKDRAAILMGGHRADLAIWLDKEKFQWVSSRFYLSDGKLPQWVEELNQSLSEIKGKVLKWEVKGPGTGLSATDPMILNDEWNAGRIGKTFPHSAQGGTYGSANLPLGLELTETAAEKAIETFKLGHHSAPDLLAISFSTHDYLGHAFGPNSREMEEITVQEDRVISKLINFLEKHSAAKLPAKLPAKLKDTLIVLTGDHGIVPNPEWLQHSKIEAGRISEEALVKAMEERLEKKFGKPDQGRWISYFEDFNYYLNQRAISAKNLNEDAIETEAKEAISQTPGIAHVFSASDYRTRKLPPGMHERQILHSYYPGRSGDLVVIPKPFFFMGKAETTNHITGYSYDRSVPLILSGPHIRKGVYSSQAEVIDIAPTLSFLTGILAPSLSEGRVLSEALLNQ